MVTGIQDYFHYASGHGQIGRLIMEMANDGVVVRYCDNKLHVGGVLSAINKHIQAISDHRHGISLFLASMERHMRLSAPCSMTRTAANVNGDIGGRG